MGDYTKSGEKIGTCGNAYYATLPMLKDLANYAGEDEAGYYIDPKNNCTFAFPFPMYDGKKVGEFSNFHEGQRAEFFFDLPASIESHHGEIVHHVHPRGGAGINLFIDCPFGGGKAASHNLDKSTITYRLTNQIYYKGSLHIQAECIYCQERNIFSKEEAQIMCEWIESRKHDTEEQKAYYLEISKRIKATYE